METGIPRPGEFYRHFKNRLYQVIAVAEHSETGEAMVVYQALYGDFRIYVRPLSMFADALDPAKYPDAKQKMRFQLVVPQRRATAQEQAAKGEAALKAGEEERKAKEAADWLADAVEKFFDAETYHEKKNIFSSLKDKLDKKTINDMAASLDVVLEEDSIENQYKALYKCMETRERFEGRRLR